MKTNVHDVSTSRHEPRRKPRRKPCRNAPRETSRGEGLGHDRTRSKAGAELSTRESAPSTSTSTSDVAPACGLRGWSSGAAGRAGRAASSKRRQRRKMSADDMCAPCVQAPKGRDPLQELTEKTAASEAELREIKFARMYCDKGVPRYTLLRQSWYVNRKRRSFEEDDVMTCMCDEDQGCGPGCMNRCAPLVACRARATGVCSLSLCFSL